MISCRASTGSGSEPLPRVTFTAFNSAWYQSNPALYYLRNSLKGLPYRVRLQEFTLSEPLPDVLTSIYRSQPDILCLSAYIWNRSFIHSLLPELRKILPHAKIILGGPEAVNMDNILADTDYLITGPGEGVLRSLAESGFSLPGGTYTSPAPPLRDIPFLYRHSDGPSLQGKLVYYETSRGCPFRCVYCLSANDTRNEARFDPSSARDKRRMFSELDRLVALEPKTVKFVDRSFNIHPALARLIWKYTIKSNARCEFHFEIYPDLLTENDIRLLEQAPPHRFRFEIGIQTVNPRVSRSCGRISNWIKVKPILTDLRQRTNVLIHADLLAGLPGEKFPSLLHSLDEIASTLPHEIQFGILKILPGTPMLDIARQRGYLWQDEPPYQILRTDALSFEQVCKAQALAKIINLYWNKAEFTTEWEEYIQSGNKASVIFLSLLKYHHKENIPLFGISREQRRQIFQDCVINHRE
jgi:radical SAM superfamily enzyme YgiQ (UPF0313 family)